MNIFFFKTDWPISNHILVQENTNNHELSTDNISANLNTNEVEINCGKNECSMANNFQIDAENSDFIVDENVQDFTVPNDDESFYSYPNIDPADMRTLHPYTDCSVHDALLMVYAYSIRHDLTWTAMEDLIKLMNRVIGREELEPSKYLIKKKFRQNSNCKPINHFVCQQCDLYLGDTNQLKASKIELCPNCDIKIETDTKYKKNHFITIPFRDHLQTVLERNSDNLNFEFTPPTHICDVHDSICFQNLRNRMEVPIVTLTFNTDGAKLFESTKDKSLWPLQFVINEISLEHRFKRENMFCAGIAFGKTPNMQVFLRPFIEQINMINSEGGMNFTMTNGDVKKVKIYPMIFTGDTLAKGYVLNKTQFNGYNGCPYCSHNGTLVNGQVRYCKRNNAPLRTNEQTRADMSQAQITKQKVNGYHGVSALMALNHFDVVKQIAIDKMHNVDMGVTKKLFSLFLNDKNRRER